CSPASVCAISGAGKRGHSDFGSRTVLHAHPHATPHTLRARTLHRSLRSPARARCGSVRRGSLREGGPAMAARLTFSVGKGGVNHTADVLKVQRFLNQVPPNEGGPIHRLPESGIYTDQTDLALKDYVWHQDFVIGAALESGQGQRGRLSPLLPGGMTT